MQYSLLHIVNGIASSGYASPSACSAILATPHDLLKQITVGAGVTKFIFEMNYSDHFALQGFGTTFHLKGVS